MLEILQKMKQSKTCCTCHNPRLLKIVPSIIKRWGTFCQIEDTQKPVVNDATPTCEKKTGKIIIKIVKHCDNGGFPTFSIVTVFFCVLFLDLRRLQVEKWKKIQKSYTKT